MIDDGYLQRVSDMINMATYQGIYVLVDFHQDLFSRYLFNRGSWHTGNGAPRWVIDSGDYPEEYCGIVCAHWSQNLQTNEAIRLAYRNFWNNAPLRVRIPDNPAFPADDQQPDRMQDAFVWQLRHAMSAILAHATWNPGMVVGVDPFNEPADGGMAGLTPKQWDNQKLWPFYGKVRQALDEAGLPDLYVFAEPLVFWNCQLGWPVCPPTGGGHLDIRPSGRFVFNAHFYDSDRMGPCVIGVNNKVYLAPLQDVRDEARHLDMPMFLSEFGMKLHSIGCGDTDRIIKGTFQGMEQSEEDPARAGPNVPCDHPPIIVCPRVDPYTPLISGTQWHWDPYYGRHHEPMNGNPNNVLTDKDAWNDEDFSVIRQTDPMAPVEPNIDESNLARIYPRALQGDLVNFTYNDLAHDGWDQPLDWYGIAPTLGATTGVLDDKKFALVTWQGRRSDAPTELWLPADFAPGQFAVLTDGTAAPIFPQVTEQPADMPNEVMLTDDSPPFFGTQSPFGGPEGRRLYIWDDQDTGETAQTWHYALVVQDPGMTTKQLTLLNGQLHSYISAQKLNPILLHGQLDH